MGGYLRLVRACATSTSKDFVSPLAAASAAAWTNRVAFPGPAALWMLDQLLKDSERDSATAGQRTPLPSAG